MTPLAQARARLGWSQQRLAEALGVHRVTVARWEAGAPCPRMAVLACEALERRALICWRMTGKVSRPEALRRLQHLGREYDAG